MTKAMLVILKLRQPNHDGSYTLIPTFSLREKGLMSSPLRERIQVRVRRFYQSIVDMILVGKRMVRMLVALAGALGLALVFGLSGLILAAVIASDDFESEGFSGGAGWLAPWQVSGTVDVVKKGDPQSGSWHMRLRASDGVVYRDVDLSGFTNPEFTVWVEAEDFEDEEYAALLVGPPGSLVEIQRWDDDADDEEYHLYTFELSAFDTSGTFRIQFESHMSGLDDPLFVDEISFSDGEPPSEAPNPPSSGNSPAIITLDGEFNDWSGRANIDDVSGDAKKSRGDILKFYWGDNENDDFAYWMIERPDDETKQVKYSVHLDMNDNGDFSDDVDRIIEVKYHPRNNDSRVDIKLRRADNNKKIAEFKKNDWGESKDEGGARVEFGIPFSDLGFSFGSVFRMYVESSFDDRAPDTGDIQWSPIPILGYIGVGIALVAGGGAIWWFRLRRFEGKEVPQS